MSRLVYSSIVSLDGYVEDPSGSFQWAAPDEEVHAFINERERAIGTFLFGRRLYDTMVVWETWDTSDEPEPVRDYAEIWRAAEKIVYSRTLSEPGSARTRIEREFDPAAVAQMKDERERDLEIGGPELAAHALHAGLVDEVNLFVNPIVVGGGKPALPPGLRLGLELQAERRFGSGVVFLSYSVS